MNLCPRGNTTQVLYDAALMSKRTADAEKVVAAQAALQTARDRVGYTELVADRDGVVTSSVPTRARLSRSARWWCGSPSRRSGKPCSMSRKPSLRAAPKEPVIEVALSRRAGHYGGGPRSGGLTPGRSCYPDPYRPDSAGEPARCAAPRRHRDGTA